MHKFLFVMLIGSFSLYGSDVNVDPQRQDSNMQREQLKGPQMPGNKDIQQEETKDIQFKANQNLEQEKTHDREFQDHNFKQEKEIGRI